tara:strand:- start:583 stop:861 length:279 start_codon:yes stop_codon:yes gene_type:complete
VLFSPYFPLFLILTGKLPAHPRFVNNKKWLISAMLVFKFTGSRAGKQIPSQIPRKPWFLLEEFGSLAARARALQITPQPPLSSGSIRGVWEL